MLERLKLSCLRSSAGLTFCLWMKGVPVKLRLPLAWRLPASSAWWPELSVTA